VLTKRWFPYICKKETNIAVLEMKKVCLFCYKPTLMFISVDSFIKLCCKQKLEIQGSSVLIARTFLWLSHSESSRHRHMYELSMMKPQVTSTKPVTDYLMIVVIVQIL